MSELFNYLSFSKNIKSGMANFLFGSLEQNRVWRLWGKINKQPISPLNRCCTYFYTNLVFTIPIYVL